MRVQIPMGEGAILRATIGQPRTCSDMSGGRYTQSDSAGGRTDTVRMPIGVYYMGCTLALPGEPFVCGVDGALCKITLTICLQYSLVHFVYIATFVGGKRYKKLSLRNDGTSLYCGTARKLTKFGRFDPDLFGNTFRKSS